MTKKSAISIMIYLLAASNYYACSVAMAESKKTQSTKHTIIRAEGILAYFPADVQSREAWYGHNFMVADTPVQPTEKFPAAKLLEYVGKRISVGGVWNAGTAFDSNANQSLPMPMDGNEDKPVMRNDGIRVEFLDDSVTDHKK